VTCYATATVFYSQIYGMGISKKKGSVVVMLRLSELGKVRNAEAEAE
jgi:hypothetical protein